MAHLDVCSGWIGTKVQFATQIAQFLPLCRRVFRQNGVVLMFSVLSQNGKVYTYALDRKPYSLVTGRTLQLFTLINTELLSCRVRRVHQLFD
jgi:hypothetical protein